MNVYLVTPTMSDREDVLGYKEEFLECGDGMHGTAGLRQAASYEEWLQTLADNCQEATVHPGLCPASTFLAKDETGALVGMIDIRHRLSEYLLQFGGHIGYSVRVSRRREGIATKMLALALAKCKDLGIERVLVTCNQDNPPSAKTILANGGVLENEVMEEIEEGTIIQRYWIDLTTIL